MVFNKQEALAQFRQANYLDCRINAYPHYSGFKGINRQSPNFIFIDIDRDNFNSDKGFRQAVNKTVKNINEILGGKPTILWTGNGIHIYQPVNGIVLEQESIFSHFDQPSQHFLKFATRYLSNNKSDAHNTPAFRYCLLRIPGLRNQKCIYKNGSNDTIDVNSQITIIDYWNGIRPKIHPLLYQFYIFLAHHKIKEINRQQKIDTGKQYRYNESQNNRSILWIEKLLQLSIHEHRKFVVWRILAPYLTNIRKLSYEESFDTTMQWLVRCNELRRLDFNTNQKIKEGLRGAAKGYYPISLSKLKDELPSLYNHIQSL